MVLVSVSAHFRNLSRNSTSTSAGWDFFWDNPLQVRSTRRAPTSYKWKAPVGRVIPQLPIYFWPFKGDYNPTYNHRTGPPCSDPTKEFTQNKVSQVHGILLHKSGDNWMYRTPTNVPLPCSLTALPWNVTAVRRYFSFWDSHFSGASICK